MRGPAWLWIAAVESPLFAPVWTPTGREIECGPIYIYMVYCMACMEFLGTELKEMRLVLMD